MARVLLEAEDENRIIDKKKLSEYKASIAYDLWSFGVVLYELCFAKPLWKIGTSDNIDRTDLSVLACLHSDDELKKVLNAALVLPHDVSADLYQASQLLRKLLDPSEEKRLEHFVKMEKVLDEPFFRPASHNEKHLEEIKNELKKINLQMSSLATELRDTRNVLLKGMFEVAEATTPTMFIILFDELQDAEPSSDVRDRLQNIGEHGVGMNLDPLRGESLRDFQNYLTLHDPGLKVGKEGNFAGMHRIGSPDDGTALWTKLTNESDVEKALEKRSDQLKAEKKRSDQLFTSLLQNEQKSSDTSNGDTNTLKTHEKSNDTNLSQHGKINNSPPVEDPCFSCVTL
jgi:hypothetical protein